MSFQPAPKAFWQAELISQFFCYLNFSKNITYSSGKLKTEFTSRIVKSTSPGLLDTTFFARWQHMYVWQFLFGYTLSKFPIIDCLPLLPEVVSFWLVHVVNFLAIQFSTQLLPLSPQHEWFDLSQTHIIHTTIIKMITILFINIILQS